MFFSSSFNQRYDIIIYVYWFELFSQVSDVAHGPLVPCPWCPRPLGSPLSKRCYILYLSRLDKERIQGSWLLRYGFHILVHIIACSSSYRETAKWERYRSAMLWNCGMDQLSKNRHNIFVHNSFFFLNLFSYFTTPPPRKSFLDSVPVLYSLFYSNHYFSLVLQEITHTQWK